MMANRQSRQPVENNPLRPDTVLIFRARKKKGGYPRQQDRIDGNYHATFSLRIFQGYARALCGKHVFVDSHGALQLAVYDEFKNDMAFLGNRKYLDLYQEINSNEMCKKCIDYLLKH